MEYVRYRSFAEFWPFYVAEHAKPLTRRLHFMGTSGVLLFALATIFTGQLRLIWGMPLFGYGFAWVGHFFVEHNRPATFKHPLYSLLGDFVMYKKMWLGQMDREIAARKHG